MRRAALWWSGARLAKESLENENYSKQNRTYRKGKRATEKAKDSFTSSVLVSPRKLWKIKGHVQKAASPSRTVGWGFQVGGCRVC